MSSQELALEALFQEHDEVSGQVKRGLVLLESFDKEGFTLNAALEADQLDRSIGAVDRFFSPATPDKPQLALEGIMQKVIELVRRLVQKLKEVILKVIDFLFTSRKVKDERARQEELREVEEIQADLTRRLQARQKAELNVLHMKMSRANNLPEWIDAFLDTPPGLRSELAQHLNNPGPVITELVQEGEYVKMARVAIQKAPQLTKWLQEQTAAVASIRDQLHAKEYTPTRSEHMEFDAGAFAKTPEALSWQVHNYRPRETHSGHPVGILAVAHAAEKLLQDTVLPGMREFEEGKRAFEKAKAEIAAVGKVVDEYWGASKSAQLPDAEQQRLNHFHEELRKFSGAIHSAFQLFDTIERFARNHEKLIAYWRTTLELARKAITHEAGENQFSKQPNVSDAALKDIAKKEDAAVLHDRKDKVGEHIKGAFKDLKNVARDAWEEGKKNAEQSAAKK